VKESPRDENPGARTRSAAVPIEKRFEIFGEYVRTVLNLSTGSLLLSITFLHDIVGIGSESKSAPAKVHYAGLLGIAWLGFLFSVVGCLFYLYYLALSANDDRDCSSQLVVGNIFGLGGFGVGLVLLAIFGWCNIP
jgi:hypothetical protein